MTAVTGGAALLGESEMADTPPVSWEQEREESEGRHLQPRPPPPSSEGPCVREQASYRRRRCSDGGGGCCLRASAST